MTCEQGLRADDVPAKLAAMKHALIAWFAACLVCLQAQAAEIRPGASLAFFGFHFIDTSTEGAYNGVRADEVARIELINDYVREHGIPGLSVAVATNDQLLYSKGASLS